MRMTVDVRLLGTASGMARLARHDDSSLANLYAELLGDMARLGILDAKAVAAILRPTARPIVRLWAGLRPLIERLYLNPTLQEVGHESGLSSRQLDRLINAFVGSFDIKGTRWRETTLRVRVELAVLLLSADGVSVADIARVAGYGSSEAMARTFRDAGLPAPAIVQQAVRAARSET